MTYVYYFRPDLAMCIKEVRQNNNNSLTGLSIDEIVQQARIVVSHKKNIKSVSFYPAIRRNFYRQLVSRVWISFVLGT